MTGSNWIRNNTNAIAEAICKGMCNYFGYKYKSASSSGTTKPTQASKPTTSKPSTSKAFKPYIVRITANDGVNIRKGAGTNYPVCGSIAKGGAYTIVAEKTGTGAMLWGKLKSGAGWIALDYTAKLNKA